MALFLFHWNNTGIKIYSTWNKSGLFQYWKSSSGSLGKGYEGVDDDLSVIIALHCGLSSTPPHQRRPWTPSIIAGPTEHF